LCNSDVEVFCLLATGFISIRTLY